jgi:hypothetical protein
VCRYAINRIGFGYDTKNIVDLMRFQSAADSAALAAADDRVPAPAIPPRSSARR